MSQLLVVCEKLGNGETALLTRIVMGGRAGTAEINCAGRIRGGK
jgi:hypothetical protein